MNWDITIGQGKQFYGRVLQDLGKRLDRRALVLEGERVEFTGRLQMRYGLLKNEVQWGPRLARIGRPGARRD